ncbi:polysaccharide deacetylase [Alteromonas sp. KUL42]|uniref:polysaccharide deacetylase family protein n=1 Tax=Alteromonas sp. KUL42 TaxID=2480797 RepID=UPI001035A1D1|nr:polysaccharide deacetylase family protein [Alteromonas sp. KUL42]TAP37593.1 polysaccharide deacetylase [Alteromonas sp. KUL42]GEA06024.1 polysaccharide deacetylase [Alteromonas sp. KUL42]
MSDLTIVMYHYVRPIKGSRFPGIKGLELEGFRNQLDYISTEFNVVSTEQVVDASKNGSKLPPNACWLTFDDGYKDHFEFVLPELVSRKLVGAFFPPRAAIEENIVLDVNSVQHILSSTQCISGLISKINEYCRVAGMSDRQISKLHNKLAFANRFDDANTIYVKRMLQHALPETLRSEIVKQLFKDIIGIKLEEFSKELYMTVEEVKVLIEHGMYVGSHGSMHYWLDRKSAEEQEKEIQHSLEFLNGVGASLKDWVMCYPYGAYNHDTLSLLRKYKASIGITTKVRVANLKIDNPLELPRLDTNDLPQYL